MAVLFRKITETVRQYCNIKYLHMTVIEDLIFAIKNVSNDSF